MNYEPLAYVGVALLVLALIYHKMGVRRAKREATEWRLQNLPRAIKRINEEQARYGAALNQGVRRMEIEQKEIEL